MLRAPLATADHVSELIIDHVTEVPFGLVKCPMVCRVLGRRRAGHGVANTTDTRRAHTALPETTHTHTERTHKYDASSAVSVSVSLTVDNGMRRVGDGGERRYREDERTHEWWSPAERASSSLRGTTLA